MNRKPIRKILSGLLSVLMLFLLLCPAVLAEDVLPVPDYTVPTGLTAVYGDYLHSVTFPPTDNGYFAWDAGYPRCTTVGNVGTNTFLATYYPPNLNEFQTVHNIEVQIEVKKAKPVFGSVFKERCVFVGHPFADFFMKTLDGNHVNRHLYTGYDNIVFGIIRKK